MYKNHYAARTTQVEALSAPSAPEKKTPVETPLVETLGVSDFNGIESRLRKEIQEEAEVNSLREAVGEPVREPFIKPPDGEADAEAVRQPDGQTGGQTDALSVLKIARAMVKEGGNEPSEKEMDDGETFLAFLKRVCVFYGQEEPSKKPRLRSPIQTRAKKKKDKKEKQTKDKDSKEKPRKTKKDKQGNHK
ncbi:unnamed protein product [Brassica oleracea]